VKENFKLMKKILFIINPIAGKRAGKNISKEIIKYLDTSTYHPYFRYSEYPGHISEITMQALDENYSAIIAVGGDGTVNEAARILVHTNVPMGIVPAGSGNGLARHLQVPLSVKKAVALINRLRVLKVDAVKINSLYSFCVAGIGFDAEVSRMFQNMKTRGLISYIIASLKCFNKSKNQNFIVKTKEKEVQLNGFMLCLANASQFGNNAYIAPKADISDGILNLILLKKPSFFQLPGLIYKVFTRNVHRHSCWSQKCGNSFEILQKNDYAHLDGELLDIGTRLKVDVEEKALTVIY
jgi:YegS/Rv2252/BmrU family lipid kinase